jgi:N-acylneuraminate cytidylyltransferase
MAPASPRFLAVVPARGGSKGLPGKNVMPLAGRPLLEWTARAALGCPLLDRAVLSTDDPQIMAVGRACGLDVPFTRPAALAADDTPMVAALLHALEAVGGAYDYLVCLQPTSPLRVSEDITACIRLCLDHGAPSATTLAPAAKQPNWMFRLRGRRMEPLLGWEALGTRRQDLAPAYALNGAVYVASVEQVRRRGALLTEETLGWVMPAERSVDVDTRLDLMLCEAILAAQEHP